VTEGKSDCLKNVSEQVRQDKKKEQKQKQKKFSLFSCDDSLLSILVGDKTFGCCLSVCSFI